MKRWRALALGTLSFVVACHHATVDRAAGAPVESMQRGDTTQLLAPIDDDAANVIAAVIRRVSRRDHRAARWIDPRPLADRRDARADSLVAPDATWAEHLALVTELDHTCVLGLDDDACEGMRGPLMRFSRVFRDGERGARVFARLVPNYDDRGPRLVDLDAWEMRYDLRYDGGGWRLVRELRVTHR